MWPAPTGIFGLIVPRHRTNTDRGCPVSRFARLSRCCSASSVSVTHHASSPRSASHGRNQLTSNPVEYVPRYSRTVSARAEDTAPRPRAEGGSACIAATRPPIRRGATRERIDSLDGWCRARAWVPVPHRVRRMVRRRDAGPPAVARPRGALVDCRVRRRSPEVARIIALLLQAAADSAAQLAEQLSPFERLWKYVALVATS